MSEEMGLVEAVLKADHALRAARVALLDAPDANATVAALTTRVGQLMDEPSTDETGDQLACLAELLGDIGTADANRTLIRILGHDDPASRQTAGEALLHALHETPGEVARLLEAEVDKSDAAPMALMEIPFILAEVGEPGGAKIIARLLKHGDADVVASAIEGLAQFNDPTHIKMLESLRKDKRKITTEDEDGQNELTVGELAQDAIEHLRSLRGD